MKRQSKVIQCCGQDLECSRFTNTCEICGRDYNWNGSLLAPRSCWGEETGESVEDILAIDTTDPDKLLEGD